MDLDKIITIKHLVSEIKKGDMIDNISNNFEELYKTIEPLVDKGNKISDIIASALASYNSLMCVPDVLM